MTDNWYIRKQKLALSQKESNMHATIKKGSQGDDVVDCQKLLNQQGFPTSVDGIFGSGTEQSVKSFQALNGLTPDGIVGQNTWAALEQVNQEPATWERVAELLGEMTEQEYKLSGAQCPSNPPGVSLQRIGKETTNCVLFTAWVLSYTFPNVKFTGDQWSLWMVSKSDTSSVPLVPGYGPRVILEWGCGNTSPSDGPWLVQYFTETGGHSLLVVAHDKETDKILTLEAIGSLEGAGWGQIGPLRDITNPGANWPDKVRQTWSSRFGPKRSVHVVSLNISGVKTWLESA